MSRPITRHPQVVHTGTGYGQQGTAIPRPQAVCSGVGDRGRSGKGEPVFRAYASAQWPCCLMRSRVVICGRFPSQVAFRL